ncbi:uncharacterized protein [Ptychodera flava]|uniref:uncharacterized protein n=1 Tax=Ptychodera flava TaxID=63121 RepID=UPI00396A9117
MAAARRRREEIVDALLVCEEDDSDLDMLLTDTFSSGRNLENTPVNLDQFSDDECFEFFRFAKPDLTRLHDGLSLQEKIVGYNGTAATSMEALLILLRRLAYPNRWCDLVTFFQRDEPELSIIFNTIVEHIYEEFGHLLTSLNLVWLDLVTFAEAVHNKGATLDNCWGSSMELPDQFQDQQVAKVLCSLGISELTVLNSNPFKLQMASLPTCLDL